MSILLALALLLPAATEVHRYPSDDANQGAVSDGHYLYAIDNAAISKIDPASGRIVARWTGDKVVFRHMNSCSAVKAQLVCAMSNYPDVPMASSIEWFDTAAMKHVATHSIGPGRGSLTWIDWHDGSWWACFANYDPPNADGTGPKGGFPGRDHRATTLVRFAPNFAEQGAWLFPPYILERMAPFSLSGGAWGADGYLYVTGHDRPEMYVVALPEAGPILTHVATIPIPTNGQAIAWDPKEKRLLWSIERSGRELVGSMVPEVADNPTK
jgi:hypothetical protein